MKKFLELIIKDPGLKLIALLFSAAVWFIVMNVTDPKTTQKYQVPLTLDNYDMLKSNKKVLNNQSELDNKVITVTVEGASSKLKELEKKMAGFKASVDFSLAELLNAMQYNDTLMTGVQVTLPLEFQNELTIVRSNPNIVGVSFDYVRDQTFVVQKSLTGDVAEGYVNAKDEIDPSVVLVTGPSKAIGLVNVLKAEYDLNGATEDIDTQVPIKIYGDDGQLLNNSQLTLSSNSVRLRVDVLNRASKPVKRPTLSGIVAEGYEVVEIRMSADLVEVIGEKADLDNFTGFELDPVDVTDLSATHDFTIDLKKYLNNTNISFPYDAVTQITVTVKIEKRIEKEFEIPVQSLSFTGLSGEIEFLTTEPVKLTLQGIESLIDSISLEDITATADLSGLAPGEHSVSVIFVIPDGTTIVSEDAKINLLIKESAPQETAASNTESP